MPVTPLAAAALIAVCFAIPFGVAALFDEGASPEPVAVPTPAVEVLEDDAADPVRITTLRDTSALPSLQEPEEDAEPTATTASAPADAAEPAAASGPAPSPAPAPAAAPSTGSGGSQGSSGATFDSGGSGGGGSSDSFDSTG